MLLSVAQASVAAAAARTDDRTREADRVLAVARERVWEWLRALAADFLRPVAELPLHESVLLLAQPEELLPRALAHVSPRTTLYTALSRPWELARLAPPPGCEGARDLLHAALPDLVVAFRLFERAKGRMVHLGEWWAQFRQVFRPQLGGGYFASKGGAGAGAGAGAVTGAGAGAGAGAGVGMGAKPRRKSVGAFDFAGEGGDASSSVAEDAEGTGTEDQGESAEGASGEDEDGDADEHEREAADALKVLVAAGIAGGDGSEGLHAGHGSRKRKRSSKQGGFGMGPLAKARESERRGGAGAGAGAAGARRAARDDDAASAALAPAEQALLARFWRAVEQLRRHGVLAPSARKGRTDYVDKVLYRVDAW
jgi:hypothetical protein